MKKIFLLIFIGTLTLLPTSALMAQVIGIENPLEAESFEDLLNTIVTFIFWIAIAIAPVMIMIAAFFLLTAGGDPKRIDTAKQIILWTVIGLAIILLAKGLISVLRQIIGVQ
ncbi:MAG: TrbC/VirB2 family protein [bacterium]|nr:TrbC/VirB2 family protein [bacterium]